MSTEATPQTQEPNLQAPPKPVVNAEPEAELPKSPSDLIIDALFGKDWKETEKVLRTNVPLILNEHVKNSGLDKYNLVLFLDQSNQLGEEHADRVYAALSTFKQHKDILLILGSKGGRIEPAYLISKNCKATAKDKFIAAVPRRAKSAATLISLGADEIHMGAMSELGPIDPQLGHIPALSLTNALQTIAKLVTDFPGSADMFSSYLQAQLNLGMLGYFERINESATQYASRLLQGKVLGKNHSPESLANHLVNHYKDHSFVIDKDEALELFGNQILKINSKEYALANAIDQNLRWISRFSKMMHRKVVTFVGSCQGCIKVRDVNDDEE